MTQLRPEFQGSDALEVYQEGMGPTDYVPGRGADMVPRRVDRGGIGTHILRGNQGASLGGGLDFSDRVLFVLNALSETGIRAARARIDALVEQGKAVTLESTLEGLLEAA